MPTFLDRIQSLFTHARPLPPGNYHYLAPAADPRNYRLHLRLEADGRGILIVNASTILHLNRTAAEFAFYMVQNVPEEQAARNVAARYRVDEDQALADYREFHERLDTLISTPDLDPVTYLGFDRQEPFSGDISAPYRLDCALTYSLPEGGSGYESPADRVQRELTSLEWKSIIDKAWGAGIPHIVFTGGEPTLRDDLPELIAKAERNSQVTGLLTDGIRLADSAYLDHLLLTGLDHLTVILQPEKEQAWKAIENALAADIFTAVHLTLTRANHQTIPDVLKRLAQAGVKGVSLSQQESSLSAELAAANELAAELGLEPVWNLPVPYSSLNPVSLEVQTENPPEGAGRAWLYVEPDGDVLPGQGIQHKLGNFLSDPWEKIWKK
jgi:organic radical activating enzyme